MTSGLHSSGLKKATFISHLRNIFHSNLKDNVLNLILKGKNRRQPSPEAELKEWPRHKGVSLEVGGRVQAPILSRKDEPITGEFSFFIIITRLALKMTIYHPR